MPEQKLVQSAIDRFLIRIQFLNPQVLNISDPNKVRLQKYIDDYPFYMSLYSQLLSKSLSKLKKPLSESTFADYGGGCGMLSFLAKEIGFKIVVYNDICADSTNDTKLVSEAIGLEIDHYMTGDIQEFIDELNLHKISPDLICSFDVLEHIYNIEFWIKTLARLDCDFSLIFMTTANPDNPFVSNRIRKLHLISETRGCENNIRFENTFLKTSFLNEREKIINLKFPALNKSEIKMLSVKTRGLRIDDIMIVIDGYINTGIITYKNEHPSNTCDPYTGSWTERLLDLKNLRTLLKNNNFRVEINNTYYGYSKNKVLNGPKFILNRIIRFISPNILCFSPAFILEVQKKAEV